MPCALSTDSRTTNLVDVNWTVFVISQRPPPPVLLMTPRITPPAHRRGCGPRGGWTPIFARKASEFQTAKRPSRSFKVTGRLMLPFNRPKAYRLRFPISRPLQLCLYLAPFPRYYHLFLKI